MPTAPSTADLYTTIKNISGVEKVFGYLPPHGKKLLAGQQFSVFGDIADQISIPPRGSRRKREGLERDLVNQRLTILSTPRPILLDPAPPADLADPADGATAVAPIGGGAVGGFLAPGTYRLALTRVTATGGETKIGNTESAPFVVAAGNIPQATLPALGAGAVSFNVYLTLPGGASGTEILYATGVTGATFDLTTAAPQFAPVPGANTTLIPTPTIPPVVDPNAGGDDGGKLQAGAYFGKYTYKTALGETMASPVSINFVVVLGAIPIMNVPELPSGCTAARVYLTQAGGGAGTETFYKEYAGGEDLLLSIAQTATGAALPGANTARLAPPTAAPIVDVSNANAIQFDFLVVPATGGNVSKGKYTAKFTFVGTGGETTASPASAQFEVTENGQIPVVRLPFANLPAGITSCNLYVTAPNGAAGTEKQVLTGIKNNTVLLLQPTEGQPVPQDNTTSGCDALGISVTGAVLGTVAPSWGCYRDAV
jgi:hypothetical protein